MSIKRTGCYNDDVPAMEAEIERLTAEVERLRAQNADFAAVIVEGNNSEMDGERWNRILSVADSIHQQLIPEK